jgi:hypothetical protein
VRFSRCCSAIPFVMAESPMILSVPSRFGEAAMVETAIGYFGDERRGKAGELLVERIARRQVVCLRKLGDGRAEQAKFRRFLMNDAVTVKEMVSHRAALAARAAVGRHVLAIQDTTEINYEAQRGRKRKLGTVGNGTDVGLFVHLVLGIDADTEQCFGLLDAYVWRRCEPKAANYKCLPIEDKESYRWVRGGAQAKAVLTEASMITIMDVRAIFMKNGLVCRTTVPIF